MIRNGNGVSFLAALMKKVYPCRRADTSAPHQGLPMPNTPDLIADAQTTEERFLRQIFVRDQMAEWSKQPLIMAKADGVHYWDVHGKRYLDALSGIYVVSVGHNNRRVIEAIRKQLDTLHFSPPMHGTNPVAVQLANLLAELAPGDLSTVKFQCGGSRGHRGGDQAGPAVSQAHRQSRQVQDHQPLPVLARLDAGLAVGLGAEVRARRSTSRWPPASSTSSRRPATAARSARAIPTAASPAPRSSAT